MAKKNSAFSADQLNASSELALALAQDAALDSATLVSAWVDAGNAAAVQAVAEGGQGAARKAARRGLNVLKSRGIAVPPRGQSVGTTNSETESTRQAWLMPPDSSGIEGVVLAERQASGRYQSCFVFFRAGQNILRAQSGLLSLSKIKDSMRQSLGGAGYSAVSVPWAWAQYRVLERRTWHVDNKVIEPLGLMGAQALLAGAPETAPPHPFDEEGLALGDEDAEKLARDSGKLHRWAEFRSWLPGERAVQELLIKIGNRMGPEPPTDQASIDPIIREEVAAATDRYFTPERRAALSERMKDSALSILAREGESAALEVAAVIQFIVGAGLITNPPSDVKFLSAYFDKAISLLASQQGGQLRIPVPRASALEPSEVPEGESPAPEEGESPAPAPESSPAPQATP